MKFLSLVKTILISTYRIDKLQKSRRNAMMGLMGGLLGLFSIILALTFYFTAVIAADIEMTAELVSMLLFIAQVVVLIFGTIAVLQVMFFSKDTEFMLSLPVKNSTLFLAKMTVIYLGELTLVAALIPSLIVVGIAADLSAVYYIMIVPAILLLPLLPLLISALLSFPLMYIVSFFRKRGALGFVAITLLFLGFFTAYMLVFSRIQNIGDSLDFEEIVPSMIGWAAYVYPAVFLANFMTGDSGLQLLYFIGSLIGIFAVAVFVCSLIFRKAATISLEAEKNTGGGDFEYRESTQSKSLIIKDFKCLIRDTGFAFQSFMGVFIAPLLVALLPFMSAMNTAGTEEIDMDLINTINTVTTLFVVLILSAGVNYVAHVAFTREGKTFYFNKFLPVDYNLLVKAKLKFANTVSIVSAVLITISAAIFIELDWSGYIGLPAVVLLVSFGSNALGVDRDIMRPKLDWNNVKEALKQNYYAMIPTLFVTIFAIVAIIVGTIALILVNEFAFWTISVGLSIAYFFIFYHRTKKDYTPFFERIEP
jgi:ABC-2 type transport system permease protein